MDYVGIIEFVASVFSSFAVRLLSFSISVYLPIRLSIFLVADAMFFRFDSHHDCKSWNFTVVKIERELKGNYKLSTDKKNFVERR